MPHVQQQLCSCLVGYTYCQSPCLTVCLPVTFPLTDCDRDAASPARPLMLSSAVSLPPVGELTTLRSDIDSAVAAYGGLSLGPPSGVPTRPGYSTPSSPHQTETPTLGHRPTSPFAIQSTQVGPVCSHSLPCIGAGSVSLSRLLTCCSRTLFTHFGVPSPACECFCQVSFKL